MSATAVAVGTMKVAQISKPGAGFQIVEREIPEPGAGQVAKQELHSHLLGVQMYPAQDGESWCYFAEGTWDLIGNAPVGPKLVQPEDGRFGLVAGAYRELKPPPLSFRYRLAVQRRIPLILRPRRLKGPSEPPALPN